MQLEPVGAYWIWLKPFDALAVIEPDWPVSLSLRSIWRPCAVSCSVIVMWSPGRM